MTKTEEQIFEQLRQAALNLNDDLLAEILDKVKSISKDQILSLLKDYNADFQIPINTEQIPYKQLITIRGINQINLEVRYLISIEEDDIYDEVKEKPEYRIVINKDSADSKMYLSNRIIKFYTQDQRNKELGRIKRVLKHFNITFS